MTKPVDLMINCKNIDSSREALEDLTRKVVALGYNDFHQGALYLIGQTLGMKYISLEVAGYESHDLCWATRPDSTDIVVDNLEEFLSVAAQHAPKEQA